jgi:hypothetical protein
MAKAATKNSDSTANIGFEAKLWLIGCRYHFQAPKKLDELPGIIR